MNNEFITSTRVMRVLKYNASTHTFILIDNNSANKIVSDRTGIQARYITATPPTGTGAGTFNIPQKNDLVVAVIVGYKTGESCHWTSGWVIGYADQWKQNETPDVLGDEAQAGDSVVRGSGGTTEVTSPSGGYTLKLYNSYAQETVIPGQNMKKSQWAHRIERLRGGLVDWGWFRPPDTKKGGAGKTVYNKVITDGYEDDFALDYDDECGTETVESNVQYRDKIIFQAGSLSDGSDTEGSLNVGDDAGATYRIISKQTAVKDSIGEKPTQFTRLVFGRAIGALKQLFGLFVWDKAGSSKFSFTVNEGGYGNVHGASVVHKQAAGEIKVILSKDGTEALSFDVAGKCKASVKYDGNVEIDSGGKSKILIHPDGNIEIVSLDASGKIKLGGTGKEQQLVTKAFLDLYYTKHVHMGNMGAPTSPPIIGGMSPLPPSPPTDTAQGYLTNSTLAE